MREQNTPAHRDPVTGLFDNENRNLEMSDGNLHRGSGITRRHFLQLAGLMTLAACTPLPDGPNPYLRVVAKSLRHLLAAEKARTGPLYNLETGRYNPEALQSWRELEPQPKLDPRIDVAIVPSRYVRGEGAVEWHVDVAAKLGFQSVSIAISPPEHQNHIGIPGNVPLDELIKRSYHDQVFSHPGMKRIHVTCDVASLGTANGWMFPGAPFTEQQLQATYLEYYNTASILLERYGDRGKEIIIGGPNEIDLLCKGGYKPATEDADISPQAAENAIAYFNTSHRAVRDANQAHWGKTPLKTGVEVLQIRSEWDNPNANTALNTVIPALAQPPDEVSLSAWQIAGKGQEGYLMGAAMRLMRKHAPHSELAVSEFGLADGDRPEMSRKQIAEQYQHGMQTAWGEGANRFSVWSLTGYDAQKDFPNNDEIRGLGLIRPDGSLRREVYSALRQLSGVDPLT